MVSLRIHVLKDKTLVENRFPQNVPEFQVGNRALPRGQAHAGCGAGSPVERQTPGQYLSFLSPMHHWEEGRGWRVIFSTVTGRHLVHPHSVTSGGSTRDYRREPAEKLIQDLHGEGSIISYSISERTKKTKTGFCRVRGCSAFKKQT